MKLVLGVLGIAVLFSGCAQKVQIRALQPAQIARAAETKKISVVDFLNDRVNLSGKIEAKIAQSKVDGKSYFTTISRKDFSQILNEQKIQNSGLIDPSTAVQMGHVIGAQAIISGDVSRPSMQDTNFYERRTKCNKDHCWEVRVYCTRAVASLTAEIRMVDTARGDIIYADTLTRSGSWTHCSDDSRLIPSLSMASQGLAEDIGEEFVSKLAPHYVYFNVELLETADIDYSDRQKLLLKSSLEYIKANRFDKAETLLTQLIDSTAERSYVPLYNLGVVKEAQGKYSEAKALYMKADSLTIKPVEQINVAINHIDSTIEQNRQALSQINKK